MLEIAYGTGEHALWMARSLPQVTWQPSEATREGLFAIEDWRALCPDLAGRVLPTVMIDAARHGPAHRSMRSSPAYWGTKRALRDLVECAEVETIAASAKRTASRLAIRSGEASE